MKLKSINQLYRVAGFNRDSEHEDFDVFDFKETYPDVKNVLPLNTRNFYIMFLVEDLSDGFFCSDNKMHRNLKDVLICVGPNHSFTGARGEAIKGYATMFNSSFTMQCAKELNIELLAFNTAEPNIISLSDTDKGIMLSLFKALKLERSHRKCAAYSLMAILAKTHQIYCKRESLACCNDSDNQLAYKFRMLIQEHISNQHDVNFYAQACNHTPTYFSEKIKLITGYSPKQLIIQHLIVEAKKHLIHSKKSVKEISYSLGYQDSSYFGRIFKEQTNMRPLEYRKKKSINIG